MSVYLCRTCGGALNVVAEMTGCKCSFCGTEQSLPRLNISEKSALLERADNYWRNGNYSGAAGLYEQALAYDIEDADVYFMLLLCRYGVSYRDNAPVITRFVRRPVTSDDNYKSAIFYGDEFQRSVFRYQAGLLSDYHSRLINATDSEKYDIFLCLNRSSQSSCNTAARLHRMLSTEGYSVFIGQELAGESAGKNVISPYTIAALNSSSVMLVLAEDEQELFLPQMKTEWGDFLSLLANGKSLVLLHRCIPADKLPRELSIAHSIDISAQGFEQDLLRGLDKLLRKQRGDKIVVAEVAADCSVMLHRARLYLENGDFGRALEFCGRVFQLDEQNAEAYFVKQLAKEKCRAVQELCQLKKDIGLSDDYQMAFKFGEPEFRQQLEKYRLTSLRYVRDNARTQSELNMITLKLCAMGNEEDIQLCLSKEKELEARLVEERYQASLEVYETSENPEALKLAAEALSKIPDYKDSSELMGKCCQKQKQLVEKYMEQQRKIQRENRRRALRVFGVLAGILVLYVAIVVTVYLVSEKVENQPYESSYQLAMQLREQGRYDEAYDEFVLLGDYSDSAEQMNETRYQQATEYVRQHRYDEAYDIFYTLGNYKDSLLQMNETRYQKAMYCIQSDEYDEAYDILKSLGDYNDSRELLADLRYQQALHYFSTERYDEAARLFRFLGDYKDCPEKAVQAQYSLAEKYAAEGQLKEAVQAYEELDSPEAAERRRELCYNLAAEYTSAEKYADAEKHYILAGDYKDSPLLLTEVRYLYAEERCSGGYYYKAMEILESIAQATTAAPDERLNAARYNVAAEAYQNESYDISMQLYRQLGDYLDSGEGYLSATYAQACYLKGKERYQEAEALFQQLGDYSDSRQQIISIRDAIGVQAGDVITFGSFMQEKDGGVRPIEWIVLKSEGGQAMLISKYLLSSLAYNSEQWDESYICDWLNNGFYSSAFTEEEQKRIIDHDGYHVTLLYGANVNEQYFVNESDRIGVYTDYCKRVMEDNDIECDGSWWLYNQVGKDSFQYVSENGIRIGLGKPNNQQCGIRPVIIINLWE